MITLQYQAPTRPVAPDVFTTEFRGCGWFDSSYELARGAQVREGFSVEEFDLWVLARDRQLAAKSVQ